MSCQHSLRGRIPPLEYGSYLAYTPKPVNKKTKDAYELMKAIKNNRMLDQKTNIIDEIINMMKKELNSLPFNSFFAKNTMLIPVPRSSLMRRNSLWVPQVICSALQRNSLGKTYEILRRIEPIPQSSRSRPEDRPSPYKHYQSLRIQKTLVKPEQIVLVDDIITRGHTVLGAAWRVAEAYPGARIIAFALMRTVSNPSEFKSLFDPVLGKITFRPEAGDAIRRP